MAKILTMNSNRGKQQTTGRSNNSKTVTATTTTTITTIRFRLSLFDQFFPLLLFRALLVTLLILGVGY